MTDFSARVAALRAQRESEQAPPPPEVEHDADLIPDVESGYERTEVDDEIDAIVARIDILEAYSKWCGKMEPKVGSKRESIMISCPFPEHPDRTPSAWINLDKQTWFCGSCNEGGDKLDIAAIKFGVPDYKHGANFPKLMRVIAESEGYVVETTPGGLTYVTSQEQSVSDSSETIEGDPEPQREVEAPRLTLVPDEPEPPVADNAFSQRVHSLKKGIDPDAAKAAIIERDGGVDLDKPLAAVPDDVTALDDDEIIEYPQVPWREFLVQDTFLKRWMEVTSHDDVPEEYYFWLGMQAAGLAMGRDCTLSDNPPVTPNLFVCLYGSTGDGKSRSIKALTTLLAEALPYDHDDEYSTGTMLVPTPGSAEALIDSFCKPVMDPSDPKKVLGHSSVRGLVRMDELSALMARAGRSGSALKPTLMEFFDCYNKVELRSRGAGHVQAVQPFASFITTSQPGAIRELVTRADADSGFMNRWVIAAGREKKKVSFGRKRIDTSRCVDQLRAIRAFASTTSEIGMSAEALDIWDSFFLGELESDKKADETKLLTRGDLMLKKIMLILAVDRGESEVSGQTAFDSVALWAYMKRAYKLLGGEIGLGAFEDAKKMIVAGMLAHEKKFGKGMAVRDLNRYLERKRIPIEVSARLIPMMVQHHIIKENVIKPERGPSTVRYEVIA